MASMLILRTCCKRTSFDGARVETTVVQECQGIENPLLVIIVLVRIALHRFYAEPQFIRIESADGILDIGIEFFAGAGRILLIGEEIPQTCR